MSFPFLIWISFSVSWARNEKSLFKYIQRGCSCHFIISLCQQFPNYDHDLPVGHGRSFGGSRNDRPVLQNSIVIENEMFSKPLCWKQFEAKIKKFQLWYRLSRLYKIMLCITLILKYLILYKYLIYSSSIYNNKDNVYLFSEEIAACGASRFCRKVYLTYLDDSF